MYLPREMYEGFVGICFTRLHFAWLELCWTANIPAEIIKVVTIIKSSPHPLVILSPTCHFRTPSHSAGNRGLQVHSYDKHATPTTLIPSDPQPVTAYATHQTLVTRMNHFYRRQHGCLVRRDVLVVRSVTSGYVPPNRSVYDWNLHTELLSIAVPPAASRNGPRRRSIS